jgi:hypothetical protein
MTTARAFPIFTVDFMETPYGEIPEKFVTDMTIQEMHDYLAARGRFRRGRCSTTAPQGLSDFRFTMVGDEATSDSTSLPIAQSIAALNPRFTVVVGDLSYPAAGLATGGEVTKTVPSGGTVHPQTDGTTYIGADGGGQSLYTGWYGV